jgi:hypothetical protein
VTDKTASHMTTVATGRRAQIGERASRAGCRRAPRTGSALGAIAALAIALAGCGSTLSAQTPARSPASSATLSAHTSAQSFSSSSPAARAAFKAPTHPRPTRIDGFVNVAKATYHEETMGAKLFQQLARIARDGVLLNALSRNDLADARAEAHAQLKSPLNHFAHVTRISVIRGSRVLVNSTVNSDGVFVVAPGSRVLRQHGRSLGTLLVSLQDVTGFVKLVHRRTGADILVRGASGRVRTSLGAAAGVRLPLSGHITIAGRGYFVRSFHEVGWGNKPHGSEPLTVWILAAG